MTHFDVIEFEFNLLWIVLMLALIVVPFVKISEKSGHNAFLGLLILIPVVNLFFLYYLAFSKWKNSRSHSSS